MRESLTILAIVLIVVLTTALVGPYFVDWNAHRAAIETRLSQLLGAKVTVGGPIDVKLLPRPIFRLGDVAVVGPSPRAAAASATRLDVELALTALLRGEFVFVDADLIEPRLTLVMANDGSVVLPRFAATDPDHVSLGHAALHDGSVLVVGEDGKPVLSATGLSGDAEAESLVGPFRFAGQVDTPHGVVPFRLNTGAIDAGKVRIKATLDSAGGLPRTDAEGVLALPDGANGAARPLFDGSIAAADVIPLPGSAAVVPWRFTGRVHADARAIEVPDLEMRVGAEGRALVMNGKGHIALGPQPGANFTLRARQADLPHFAVLPGRDDDHPAQAGPTAPDAATLLAGLRALGSNPAAFAGLPLPVTADLAVEAVTLGRLTLGDLAGHLVLKSGAPLKGTLAIGAPDGSHVALDGSFETGPAAVFRGRLEASTHDLGRLADSLAPDLPDVADALHHALPARSVAFGGAIDLSGVGFAAHDAILTLDRSRFTGTITLTRAVGADRARLFADLTSDALDLDALPDWRDTATAASSLDLSVSLAARAVRLAQSDTGTVETGRASLQLSKLGSNVTLERLLLADVGGATADLTGGSDGRTAHLEGRLDATRLRDLLALTGRLAPSQAADQLLQRADALSPALLKIALAASVADASRPQLSRVALDGTVAGTSILFRLAPTTDGPTGFAATLKLDAPEAGALLRQLGVATLPGTAIGRSRFEAEARLDDAFRPGDGTLTATLADTVVSFRGHGGASAGLTGRATVAGSNIGPLLRAVSLAVPEAGAVWPVDLGAEVAVHGPTVTLANLAGRVLGSGVKGSLAYVIPPAETAASVSATVASAAAPVLTGSITVDRLALPAVLGLALGPLPAAKPGALWPETPFAPSLASLPRADVALTVAAMPLTGSLVATDARASLKLGTGLVSLADLSARLGDGRLGGTFELRRNGPLASLSGHAEWSDLPSASPSFGGRSHGMLDLAGSGASVATLVASLAGSGTVGVDEARLPRLDAGALARAVADTGQAATDGIDDTAIRQAITADLDKGALALGAVSTPVTIAAGVLRGDPVTVTTPAMRSTNLASLDLRSLLWSLTSTVTLPNPPRDWVGSPPQVTVSWKGPFAAPAREVDATALVNGLAGRAIARDQARIEAFQDDIRERAFFARRLRAIEAEQQAARDKAEGEAQMQKLLQSLPAPPAIGLPTMPSRAQARPAAAGSRPLDLSPRALQPTP